MVGNLYIPKTLFQDLIFVTLGPFIEVRVKLGPEYDHGQTPMSMNFHLYV